MPERLISGNPETYHLLGHLPYTTDGTGLSARRTNGLGGSSSIVGGSDVSARCTNEFEVMESTVTLAGSPSGLVAGSGVSARGTIVCADNGGTVAQAGSTEKLMRESGMSKMS